jgi:hypothetical protein
MELWRPISGFEGRYEVSNLGHIRSMSFSGTGGKPRLLKQVRRRANGYLFVGLGNPARYVFSHTLVADAFLGQRPDGAQVNHIDGEKTNNTAANLEYCSPVENMQHARRLGLLSCRQGEKNTRAKLTTADVLRARELVAGGAKQSVVAALLGVDQSAISRCVSGKRWSHLEARP